MRRGVDRWSRSESSRSGRADAVAGEGDNDLADAFDFCLGFACEAVFSVEGGLGFHLDGAIVDDGSGFDLEVVASDLAGGIDGFAQEIDGEIGIGVGLDDDDGAGTGDVCFNVPGAGEIGGDSGGFGFDGGDRGAEHEAFFIAFEIHAEQADGVGFAAEGIVRGAI